MIISKTILLCLKTIYGRMIVGWYWATKLALGAEEQTAIMVANIVSNKHNKISSHYF